MRRLIVPILMLLICNFLPAANAQKATNPVIYTPGVPIACVYGRIYVDVSTGLAYTYKTGIGCFLTGGFSGGTITSPIRGADGSAAAPTYSYASENILGFFRSSAGNNAHRGNIVPATGNSYALGNTGAGLEWLSVGTRAINLGDSGTTTVLTYDGADIFALRRTTNPYTFRIYNTYTDAGNHERLNIGWAANKLTIQTVGAGTGSARDLDIIAGSSNVGTLSLSGGGTTQLSMSAAGISARNAITFLTDNTYDIGASGATRPRNIYAASALIAGTFLQLGSSPNFSVIDSPGAGVIRISNAVQTDFSRLQLGGTTSSFPSIKRNGTRLQARLADDSAHTTIENAATTIYRNVVQSINDVTWTSIGFDTELDDTNTFHDNVTNNSRITINAATAGRITFKCTVEMASGTGARAIRLYKNNTTVMHGPINFTAITGGDSTTMSFNINIPDAVNTDFYECQVFQGSGGALNTGSGRASVIFSATTY